MNLLYINSPYELTHFKIENSKESPKGATDFGWLPTKAIIIYNGQSEWDPMAEFRTKYRGQFNGRELPFECVLVNLADIPDEACLREPNVEAAVGALVMKHAFDADGLRSVVGGLTKKL